MPNTYKFELTEQDVDHLYFALGAMTGECGKTGYPDLARKYFETAKKIHDQKMEQIDGKANPPDSNPLSTDGTD